MNVYPSLSIFGALLLLLSIVGCDTADPFEEYHIVPGIIRHEMAPPHENARVDINEHTVEGFLPNFSFWEVELHEGPVPVRAGVPFEVTVYTLGSPCTAPRPSKVEMEEGRAVISVYDLRPKPTATNPCAAVLVHIPRTDTVVFNAPGEAEVVIRGNRVGGGRHPHEFRFPVFVEE